MTTDQTRGATILDDLLAPVGRCMTKELAQELINLQASPTVQARIDELAEKCNEGELSTEDRTEYESYVNAIHLIGILQRKARGILGNGFQDDWNDLR